MRNQNKYKFVMMIVFGFVLGAISGLFLEKYRTYILNSTISQAEILYFDIRDACERGRTQDLNFQAHWELVRRIIEYPYTSIDMDSGLEYLDWLKIECDLKNADNEWGILRKAIKAKFK